MYHIDADPFAYGGPMIRVYIVCRDKKTGELESYELIWENTTFKMELCDDNTLIYKVGQMHLKWLELEKEIKQKKYEMKLNRIQSDF